jgi:hypothetical protein
MDNPSYRTGNATSAGVNSPGQVKISFDST